ncbi:MAG: hypothetical protein HRT90_11710, partial [Candidatus Margulisbacteria bacterium]|nr:hypothetical protein [Candidatus Margulisiibacteriota bacterium]
MTHKVVSVGRNTFKNINLLADTVVPFLDTMDMKRVKGVCRVYCRAVESYYHNRRHFIRRLLKYHCADTVLPLVRRKEFEDLYVFQKESDFPRGDVKDKDIQLVVEMNGYHVEILLYMGTRKITFQCFSNRGWQSSDGYYEGAWQIFKDAKTDIIDGYGRFVFPDGEYYTGYWRKKSPHGYGIKRGLFGEKYEGEWRNGKQHGRGKDRNRDGKVVIGFWEKGFYMNKSKTKPRKRFQKAFKKVFK